jgi:hypothetical protein
MIDQVMYQAMPDRGSKVMAPSPLHNDRRAYLGIDYSDR